MQHSTLAGCSILLIEDNAHVSRAAHTALQGAGAHVFQASTAADALRVVEEVRLSAAVLDYTRSTTMQSRGGSLRSTSPSCSARRLGATRLGHTHRC